MVLRLKIMKSSSLPISPSFSVYRACNYLLLIAIVVSFPIARLLPVSWGWENGVLENAQAVLLFSGFAYALWSAIKQKASVSAPLWWVASLFWLAMTGRELAWGAAFAPPMGFDAETGPIISSRVLSYRPAVPWICAAMLLLCIYWLWRHQLIQKVFVRLWQEHAYPLASLALFVIAMLISGNAEGHGLAVLAQWFSYTQALVLEELVEFWAYAALWLAQWFLVQHSFTWTQHR